MDSFGSLLNGIIYGNYADAEKVGHDTVGDYEIDTCDTVDQGFETAIWKGDNRMIIVERYPDRETAVIGHVKWVEFCKSNPTEVWSVQVDETLPFEVEWEGL